MLYLFLLLLVTVVAHGTNLMNPLESRATIEAPLNGSLVSVSWYAAWQATDLPLSAIPWSKYSIVNYAFGLTTPDPSVISLADSDQVFLPQFVSAAHQHNVKASLSIGGWTGSRWFSSNVGSAENRTAFVKSVAGLIKKYDLDGIDIDWEYPGKQGIGCNLVSPNDTANFLSFLQQLRQSVGTGIILSAATDIRPFPGPSGTPFANISEFAKPLDHIVIMNYDIMSAPNAGAGPNAPLNDNCAPSDNQKGSAQSALTAWTDAGMPKHRIVLGVAMYGHSYRVSRESAFLDGSNSTLAPFPPYDINNQPKGDQWNEGGLDICGVYQMPGGTYTFKSLVEYGFLNTDGSTRQGIVYRYDSCSETPYLYDPKTNILISYDDPWSFDKKGHFVQANGLGGFAAWHMGGDLNEVLIKALLNGTLNGAARTDQPSLSASAKVTPTSLPSFASPLYSTHVREWLLVFVLNISWGLYSMV